MVFSQVRLDVPLTLSPRDFLRSPARPGMVDWIELDVRCNLEKSCPERPEECGPRNSVIDPLAVIFEVALTVSPSR